MWNRLEHKFLLVKKDFWMWGLFNECFTKPIKSKLKDKNKY
jgi:hypothetical protein